MGDAPVMDAPSFRLIGSKFRTFDPATGEATMDFVAPPEFASPRGIVHGGLVPAFLDEAMGAAVFHACEGQQIPLNLDCTISYLRPVPLGPLVGKGRIVKMGRNVCFIEGELTDPEGRVLARATSTAMLTPLPGAA